MRKAPAILIFDVGKTNKKLLVFDARYQLLHAEGVRFEEIKDEDGYPCDDVESITRWIRSSFERISRDDRFDLRAVNFSGYGASFVCVDERLQPLLQVSNYLKPFPQDLRNLFYSRYGGAGAFSMKTASPVLGSLNSGMQLFRLKQERPDVFNKIAAALHLPQYLSSILTQRGVSEITSIGCHTNLWDFESNCYHDWVLKEGVDAKLPQIISASECQLVTVDDLKIQVGPGLHDSSAALIPYLLNFDEPFVLLSTGTWCISLNPFNNAPLTSEELKQDCLCYLTYEGKPVKASRLFAGYEHDQQVRRLASHFHLDVEYFTKLKYDSGIGAEWEGVLHNNRRGTPSFEKCNLDGFAGADEAYHELMFDIMERQIMSTNLVLKEGRVKRIFVDGGFSKNNIYMNLMARSFPEIELYGANVSEASALGAALVIHKSWNDQPLPPDLIELKSFSTIKESGMR